MVVDPRLFDPDPTFTGTVRRQMSSVLGWCSMFKKLDYHLLTDEDHTWNRVKRETYYLGMRNGSIRR